MITADQLQAIAQRALDAVKRETKDAEARVNVWSSRDANARFAMGVIESCGDVSEEHVSLYVAIGKRHASATANQTDDASLASLARRAVAMAKLSPEDPESMPLLGPQVYRSVPAAFDQTLADTNAETRAATAQVAMAAAKQAGLDAAGFFQHQAERWLLAGTSGLHAEHSSTYGEITMTARTKDGTGSGWGVRASHAAGAMDASAVARAAIDKATRSANAKPLDAGRYTVVLEPAAVADLLGFLAMALDARAVDEGRSALTKPGGGSRLGEAIASDLVTLVSDPADPSLPRSPFDDDGEARKSVKWIDAGKLAALSYSRYWAAKQGKEPTPWDGWHLSGGSAASIDELVSGVKRGLLVTRFWYTRVLDPQQALVTGLTRDGVLLIEGGKITGPVNNFRWNESPLNMLKNCDAMTRDTYRVSQTACVPALRTHEFNMASVSEAV
jgi:predicted Zn-dependent protease